jgi:branched-chain amino acid transport system permease protein
VDLTIAALLTQDGITSGAIYALLALALVLVFTVTRIIWVPAGEFVAWGTLTLAGLQLSQGPGTVGLLLGMAIIAGTMDRGNACAPGRCAGCRSGCCSGPECRWQLRHSSGGSRPCRCRCPSRWR